MSSDPKIHNVIKKYVKEDSRIKVHFNKEHSHISVTSNNALALASGKFVVLMDHDDLLRPTPFFVWLNYITQIKISK